ncbi:glycosyl transferase family 2 [Arcicella aurantiaca]|uniref:Glycosyl transferase family 2 n=2 Tax=Arcicella aurantiaca TaxID=591202 RepID=A0A316DSD9_9BACT|nr:glycosyl transferase family 2 [Arcicella aurantiaca]
MIDISMPKWVKNILQKPNHFKEMEGTEIIELKRKLARFSTNNPIVSVVIPAWNEEDGILHTLISLAETKTNYDVELLIIDNNSTDGTAYLLNSLGVKNILETKQGVGHARTRGLHEAKGKYILTGDSDTLYPAGWITAMVDGMINDEQVYCVHGSYSFLPSDETPRWQYAFYEFLSGFIIRKKEKTQPFLNTLGFNSGFIRQKGIDVNGYDIETQRTFRGAAGVVEQNATEDGMMALRLQNAGGKIKAIESNNARVWTSDRRIQLDGGLKNAMMMRVKKYLFKK